jgi:hypothetical protein
MDPDNMLISEAHFISIILNGQMGQCSTAKCKTLSPKSENDVPQWAFKLNSDLATAICERL